MKGKQVQKRDGSARVDLLKLEKQLHGSGGVPEEKLIHKLRVMTKRVRAESVFIEDEQLAQRCRKKARKLARYLASTRANQVLINTIDVLFPDDMPLDIQLLRERLIVSGSEQSIKKAVTLKLFGDLKSQYEGAERRHPSSIDKNVFLNQSWSDVEKGARSLSKQNIESYHHWRKLMKRHLFYLKYLLEADREKISKVKVLAELLGDLHDLHELLVVLPENARKSKYVVKTVSSYEERLHNEIQQCWSGLNV